MTADERTTTPQALAPQQAATTALKATDLTAASTPLLSHLGSVVKAGEFAVSVQPIDGNRKSEESCSSGGGASMSSSYAGAQKSREGDDGVAQSEMNKTTNLRRGSVAEGGVSPIDDEVADGVDAVTPTRQITRSESAESLAAVAMTGKIVTPRTVSGTRLSPSTSNHASSPAQEPPSETKKDPAASARLFADARARLAQNSPPMAQDSFSTRDMSPPAPVYGSPKTSVVTRKSLPSSPGPASPNPNIVATGETTPKAVVDRRSSRTSGDPIDSLVAGSRIQDHDSAAGQEQDVPKEADDDFTPVTNSAANKQDSVAETQGSHQQATNAAESVPESEPSLKIGERRSSNHSEDLTRLPSGERQTAEHVMEHNHHVSGNSESLSYDDDEASVEEDYDEARKVVSSPEESTVSRSVANTNENTPALAPAIVQQHDYSSTGNQQVRAFSVSPVPPAQQHYPAPPNRQPPQPQDFRPPVPQDMNAMQLPLDQYPTPQSEREQFVSGPGFDGRQYHPSPPELERPMSFVPLPRDQSGNPQETIHVYKPPAGPQDFIDTKPSQTRLRRSSRPMSGLQYPPQVPSMIQEERISPPMQQSPQQGPQPPTAFPTQAQNDIQTRGQQSLPQHQNQHGQYQQSRLPPSFIGGIKNQTANGNLSAYHATTQHLQQQNPPKAAPKQSRLAALFGKKTSTPKLQPMPTSRPSSTLQRPLPPQQFPVDQFPPQIPQQFPLRHTPTPPHGILAPQHSPAPTKNNSAPLPSIPQGSVSTSEPSRGTTPQAVQTLNHTPSISSASGSVQDSLIGQVSESPSRQLYLHNPTAPVGVQALQFQQPQSQTPQAQPQSQQGQQRHQGFPYGQSGLQQQNRPPQQGLPMQQMASVQQRQPFPPSLQAGQAVPQGQISPPQGQPNYTGQSATYRPPPTVANQSVGVQRASTYVAPEPKKKRFSAMGALFSKSGLGGPKVNKKIQKGQHQGTQSGPQAPRSYNQAQLEQQQRPWNLNVPAAGDQDRDREIMSREIWYAAERRWAQPQPVMPPNSGSMGNQPGMQQQQQIGRPIQPGFVPQGVPPGAQVMMGPPGPDGRPQGLYYVHPSNPQHVVYLFPTAPGQQPQGIFYTSSVGQTMPNGVLNPNQPLQQHMQRPIYATPPQTGNVPLQMTYPSTQQNQQQHYPPPGSSPMENSAQQQSHQVHASQSPPPQRAIYQQQQALYQQQQALHQQQQQERVTPMNPPWLQAAPSLQSTTSESVVRSVQETRAVQSVSPPIPSLNNTPQPRHDAHVARTPDVENVQPEEEERFALKGPRSGNEAPAVASGTPTEQIDRVSKDPSSDQKQKAQSQTLPPPPAEVPQPEPDTADSRPRRLSESRPPSQQGPRGRPQSMIQSQPNSAGSSPGRYYSRQSLELRNQSLERPIQPIPEEAKALITAQRTVSANTGGSISRTVSKPDTSEISALPQDSIPLLQPKPKHPTGGIRYVPPALGARGAIHNNRPASYAGSGTIPLTQTTSLPNQPQLSQPTPARQVAEPQTTGRLEQQPVLQSYHPPPLPPLIRARTSESAKPKALPQRSLSTVSESHMASEIANVKQNHLIIPPPPPPKIPLPSLITTDLPSGGKSDVFSPSNYPLPQSAAAEQVPRQHQATRDVPVARNVPLAASATSVTPVRDVQNHNRTISNGSLPKRQTSASGVPFPVVNYPTRKPSTAGGQSEVYELPATSGHDDDDEPVMMAVSYPGDEWIPEWNGMD